MATSKCILLLSEKSSGSSACQNFLSRFAGARVVARTRHFESETLYWVKAAALLGMPQMNMLNSEVPFGREKAKADLITLLTDNLENYSPPPDDRDLVFDGWRLLCERYGPVFLEKSPHHLCQWSALELIVECIERTKDVDFLLLGLIRNPMDTIYSQFKRWRASPEKLQYQWLTAYRNLLRLKDIVGEQVVIVRYEDVVTSVEYLAPVLEFCGVTVEEMDRDYLHDRSVAKWRGDGFFGFALADEVVELAKQYGYRNDEMANRRNVLWPLYRDLKRVEYGMATPVRALRRKCGAVLRSLWK